MVNGVMRGAAGRMAGAALRWCRAAVPVLVAAALVLPAVSASAQGVTTGSMSGVVTDAQAQPVAGAQVIAIHTPSGTNYEAATRPDGRFFIANMRVGGPYVVTVTYGGTGTAFEPFTREDVMINLGVATDVPVQVKTIAVSELVTVTGTSDPVFSSSRTGASTTVVLDQIQTLPNLSNRLENFTRLTPQASGLSFGGQDNRLNNITVDGSYFNNSFGLGGAPGDRTGVAAISPWVRLAWVISSSARVERTSSSRSRKVAPSAVRWRRKVREVMFISAAISTTDFVSAQ